MSRILTRLAGSAFLLISLSFNNLRADTLPGTTVCTEDAISGCNGSISITLLSGTVMTITLASDGETRPFVPSFGSGQITDVSDGIKFAFNMADTTVTLQNSPAWLPTGAIATWVEPANLTGVGCGQENTNPCELLGQFLLSQKLPVGFQATTRFYYINDPAIGIDGNVNPVSDVITVGNDAATGNALVTFQSDPAPEPSTVFLVIGALGVGLGFLGRRRMGRAA
jgi:hypothetical protein